MPIEGWSERLVDAWERGDLQDRQYLFMCSSAVMLLFRAVKESSGVQEIRPLRVTDDTPSRKVRYDVLHALTVVTEASRAVDLQNGASRVITPILTAEENEVTYRGPMVDAMTTTPPATTAPPTPAPPTPAPPTTTTPPPPPATAPPTTTPTTTTTPPQRTRSKKKVDNLQCSPADNTRTLTGTLLELDMGIVLSGHDESPKRLVRVRICARGFQTIHLEDARPVIDSWSVSLRIATGASSTKAGTDPSIDIPFIPPADPTTLPALLLTPRPLVKDEAKAFAKLKKLVDERCLPDIAFALARGNDYRPIEQGRSEAARRDVSLLRPRIFTID
jgi:hypothetical protein